MKKEGPASTCLGELCQRVIQQLLMDSGSFLDKRPQFYQGFFPGPHAGAFVLLSPGLPHVCGTSIFTFSRPLRSAIWKLSTRTAITRL